MAPDPTRTARADPTDPTILPPNLPIPTDDGAADHLVGLRVPSIILSDPGHELTDALRLPTFKAGGRRLLKRHTMVIDDGAISHVFYPIFPPDRYAQEVVAWLRVRER